MIKQKLQLCKRSQMGISRIEITVVIAVSALLFSVIFTSWFMMQRHALDSKTYASARTLALALNQYVADRGTVPSLTRTDAWACNAKAGLSASENWNNVLQQLVQGKYVSENYIFDDRTTNQICYSPTGVKTGMVFFQMHDSVPTHNPACKPLFWEQAFCIPASSY